jgi:hypothetical protein
MPNNNEIYLQAVRGLFEEFKLEEFNRRVRGLNTAYLKSEDFNTISIAAEEFYNPANKKEKKAEKPSVIMGHGELKEMVKNTVKTMEIEKFTILDLMPELKKINPNIKQHSVAPILKKWVKEDMLDTDGIEVAKKHKGTKPTLYKKVKAVV